MRTRTRASAPRPAPDSGSRARGARPPFQVLVAVLLAATLARPASAHGSDFTIAAGRDATAMDRGETTPAPVSLPPGRNDVEDEYPPAARLAVTQPDPGVCTVTADASASRDDDLTPVASYRFFFGDGSQPVTTTAPNASAQHTYAVSDNYTITVIVTDTAGNASEPASVTFSVTGRLTAERRVAASADDAEEIVSGGTMKLTSSTLQLTLDGTAQQNAGLRFSGVAVPSHATILAAYLQFTASTSQTAASSLTIAGEATDQAPAFSSATGNIAARARTAASVAWAPGAWASGQAGPAQRTPDLSAVIQEIVNRPGWGAGHALAFIVTGSSSRTAVTFDANAATAALLHIEYAGVATSPTAQLSVSQARSPALTASVDGSASMPGSHPIATYQFDFGDGTQIVTNAPNAQAQHTYAAAGAYTVALIVTDTAGRRSTPATATVTIEDLPPTPISVYVGYYDTHHPDHPRTKPSPWKGSPGVTFVGTADSGTNGWDSSCIRIENLTSSPLAVTVTADIGSEHFSLWGSRSIPAGGTLILAQTGFENFDGSDTNEAGCYGCDPDLCLTRVSSTVPVVHVTMNGTTTHYYDTGQIMNTHGVDGAGCPDTGGTRNDESQAWTQIGPQAPMAAAQDAAHVQLDEAVARRPRLDPITPNPAGDVLALRFGIPARQGVKVGIYDVSGRLIRTPVDGEMEAGDYMARIDLSGIPAGVYECVLRTGGQMIPRRFVHVR
jgi:PKD repeat protein